MTDPQQEPIPDPEPGHSPWINNDYGHPEAFKEDAEFLAKYNLPPLPVIKRPENN